MTSWQLTGTGGHMDSAFWSQGSHGTYEPKHPDSPKINVTKRQKLRNIVGVLFSYRINLKCEEEGTKSRRV